MKSRIILCVLAVFCTVNTYAQGATMSTSAYFDGFWSDWAKQTASSLKGDYDNFIMYDNVAGPWEYYFKVVVNDFKLPSKKQRKKDKKQDANKFYELHGTVEYYVPVFNIAETVSIADLFKVSKQARFCKKDEVINDKKINTRKITSNATIKIMVFENKPTCYNIMFDGVGVAISISENYFYNTKHEFK